MATTRSASIRHATLDAYRSLTDGDVRPLVALLDPDIEWTERAGLGRPRSVRGAEAVAALLAQRLSVARNVELRGVEVEESALVLSFNRPWWETRPRWLCRLAFYGLNGRFTQTLTLDQTIKRIENACSVEPLAPDEQSPSDALAMLLFR